MQSFAVSPRARAGLPVVVLGLSIGLASAGCGLFPGSSHPEPATQLSLAGSGRALIQVTRDPSIEGDPSLSPDGKTLLVTAQVDEVVNGRYTGNKSESVIVGVSPRAGTARRVYTSNRFFSASAVWLPGGDGFVFTTNQMGRLSLVRSLSSAPNPAVSVVVAGDSAENTSEPDVSADGKRVCFQMDVRGVAMIGTANLDGSSFTVLTEGSSPSFSRDGKRILFARPVGDYWQLFVVDAATGSGLVQLTSDEVQHASPSWSPDGDHVVFSSNAGWDQYGGEGSYQTTWNLFALGTDGTNLTQLTTGPRWSRQAHWASDGFLYFSSNESGNWDIWRFDPGLPVEKAAGPTEPPPPPVDPEPAPEPEPEPPAAPEPAPAPAPEPS